MYSPDFKAQIEKYCDVVNTELMKYIPETVREMLLRLCATLFQTAVKDSVRFLFWNFAECAAVM